MIYVTDTHSLVWFLTGDNNLSAKAKSVFEDTEKGNSLIIIPTIVLAELLYLCEKKKVQDKFSEIIEKLKKGMNYITYNLDVDIIIECKNLIKIREMHDKIITATAKILGATIITKDKEIKESNYVRTLW
ncbi:PIN domain-containing protein [Candidatus Woesearchaeota archaeon]|nr:PIN domain-containing protein [Candidatus Woesearchaeota archaeon]